MDFEALREMESYSEHLLNRIIAFQSKEHAAWNPARPFSERIAGLSLHDLMFSHPQRDPEKNGPTIAHFIPRREEVWRIAEYARAVSDTPHVLDAHARNGFIGSLLAREGVKVTGLRDPAAKPNQIAEFFDRDCYTLRDGTAQSAPTVADVAFSAWMPSGENHTPALLALKPKLLVMIFTPHADERTGTRQTGTDAAYENIPANYRLIDEWTDERPENLLRTIWPELTGNIAETRITRVYADAAYHHLTRPVPKYAPSPYDWEIDLNMTLLAHQARNFLIARGVPVE